MDPNASWFAYVTEGLSRLYTSDNGFLVDIARRWLGYTIVLHIFWIGVQTLLLGRWDPHYFKRTLIRIVFVSVIVNGWNTPIPILGRSAVHIVTDEADSLTVKIDDGMNQRLQDRLNEAYASWSSPHWYSPPADLVIYALLLLLVITVQLVLLGVVSLGFVASGIGAMVGCLFAVSLLWPGVSHWWSAWLNAFVKYNFYKVFAAAMTFIIATALIGYMDAHVNPLANDAAIRTEGVKLCVMLMSSIYVAWQLTNIAASYFSGHAAPSMMRSRAL